MHPRSERLEPTFIVAASALLGIIVVYLAMMETRWIVFATGGVLLFTAAIIFGLERIMVVAFVVGLSIDAHYYLTMPPPSLWTGTTTPGALSIPLALVPGSILLARRLLLNRSTGEHLDWHRDISTPFGWYLGLSLLTTLRSSFWFPGLCVIWQNVLLFIVFMITLNVVRSRQDASTVVDLLLVALVGQCLLFGLQLTTGVNFNAVGKVQVVSSVWHAASGTVAPTTAGFAMFLDPLVMLAYALFRACPTPGRRTLYRSLFLLGTTVLALTLNRSTWLALPIGLGVAERLLRRRGLVGEARQQRRGLVLAPIAVLVIFILVAPMFQSVRKVKHEDDLQTRFELMKPAIGMIIRHPILGVGPGAYGFVLREYAAAAGYTGWLYIAHNDYLLIWAERGTAGLIAWILFLRATGREFSKTSWRSHSWDATVGIGALSGFAMQLWEVFWTSGMSFPAYGVIYILLGVCAGLNRHVAVPVPTTEEAPTVSPGLGADRPREGEAIPAARWV